MSVYNNTTDANGDLIAMPITNAYLQTLPQLAPVVATINAWNAANPTDPISYLNFRKRLSDIADRSNDNTRQTFRAVLGFKGDIPIGDWKYDASCTFVRTTDAQISSGAVNLANFRQSLDLIVDPTTGNIVCSDPVARSYGCVPINLFGYRSISPAATNWVNATITYNAKIREQVISAYVSGSVGELPAGKPQLVVGVEGRKAIWDPLTNAGLNGSNSIPNTIGSIDVKEAYFEGEVPILKGLPGAEALTLEGALRNAQYSTVGGANTWKYGVQWAPTRDVRLRGVYSEAIRAPNIGELYGGQSETFPTGIADPCDGTTATSGGQFAAACRAIPAVTAAIARNGAFTYNIPLDYQSINGFVGSNPTLHQEKAKTKTIGLVVTPRAVPNLSATFDFFDVRVEGAVSTVDFQTSVNQCLLTGLAAFCGNVIRSPQTGKILTINQLNVNVGSIRTSGIDSALNYTWNLAGTPIGGRLNFTLADTYLIKLEQQSYVGGAIQDNINELNSGANGRLGSGFRDRATFNVDYTRGPWEANWKINYLSAIYDTVPPVPGTSSQGNTVVSYIYNRMPAYLYHDVQVRYTFPWKPEIVTYAGANNLFNKQPPFLPSGMASEITGTETAADTYDVFGVFVYLGAEVKF